MNNNSAPITFRVWNTEYEYHKGIIVEKSAMGGRSRVFTRQQFVDLMAVYKESFEAELVKLDEVLKGINKELLDDDENRFITR